MVFTHNGCRMCTMRKTRILYALDVTNNSNSAFQCSCPSARNIIMAARPRWHSKPGKHSRTCPTLQNELVLHTGRKHTCTQKKITKKVGHHVQHSSTRFPENVGTPHSGPIARHSCVGQPNLQDAVLALGNWWSRPETRDKQHHGHYPAGNHAGARAERHHPSESFHMQPVHSCRLCQPRSGVVEIADELEDLPVAALQSARLNQSQPLLDGCKLFRTRQRTACKGLWQQID